MNHKSYEMESKKFKIIFIFLFVFKFCTAISEDSIENICKTPSCNKTGASIKATIDKSVNPCEDFYEFSCGGWKKLNPIPNDKSKFGRLTQMQSHLQKIMKEEMSKESLPTDAQSVRYAMDFFKACSQQNILESRQHLPLINTLRRLGGWPLAHTQTHYNEKSYNWKQSLILIYAFVGQSPIFELDVGPDANQTDFNTLYLDVPYFGIGRNQLLEQNANKETVNAYKKYIFRSALLLGAQNNTETHQQIEDIIEFEKQMAKVSTKPEDKRESKVWYNRMTINKLTEMTKHQMNWNRFIQDLLIFLNVTHKLKPEDNVIVMDIPYYKGVIELLHKTPKRVIANYIGWITLQNLGVFTTNLFRDIDFEFKKVSKGIQQSTPHWMNCIHSLESYLPMAYSRKYIDNHFDRTSKKEAQTVVKYVRKAMRESILTNEWLDIKTKNNSLDKLDAVSEYIGYPEWILNNKELDNYYNLTRNVSKEYAFESLLDIKTQKYVNMFAKLYKKVNKTLSWTEFPARVNAFYDPSRNGITIPAAILSDPFFRSNVPIYINLGAIGQVIGHEFTHGFDDRGSEFDKNGNLNNWWSHCIIQLFKEKTKCFINKFSQINVPELNMTLNGKNTVGEDISDAGGLKQAYNAFKLYQQQLGTALPRLPYVSEYTPEQLFFISFANILCENIRPKALKNYIEYDPHTPNKYRVNVQLTKFDEFTKAFNCKPQTRMNTGFSCSVW